MNGWMGVDLFFVLSGFLITTHICRRYDGRITRAGLKDYLTRRVLRIVPAYYAVLFVAVLGLIPLYRVDEATLGIRIAYHMLFLTPSRLLHESLRLSHRLASLWQPPLQISSNSKHSLLKR